MLRIVLYDFIERKKSLKLLKLNISNLVIYNKNRIF